MVSVSLNDTNLKLITMLLKEKMSELESKLKGKELQMLVSQEFDDFKSFMKLKELCDYLEMRYENG